MIDLVVGMAPIVGIVGLWLLLQTVILPRLGVGT
jgi:hypothetical protein